MSKRIAVGGGTKAVLASPAVPDSKVHADPQPSQYDWATLHINGQPIPEELWPNMRFGLTDEGMEAERKRKGPVATKGLSVTRDKDDKRTEIFRDGLLEGNPMLGSDPLQLMMDRHLPAGMSGLWIGAKKASEAGLMRGVLEYKPVMIDDPENPGTKIKVTQNGMFLAMVPIESKLAADRMYREMADSRQAAVIEKVEEQTDRVMQEQGGLAALARRKRVSQDVMGIETEDGDMADSEIAATFQNEQIAHVSE